MADDLAATLAGIGELVSERDELLGRMNTAPFGGEEWQVACDGFTEAQGKLAARVPGLLAALDEVLRLTAPPGPLDVLFDIPLGSEVDKAKVREAITRSLAGKEESNGS